MQKYDLERDEAQCGKIAAAAWGVDSKSSTTKSPKPAPSNGQKQTITQQDIMRNYAK